jgi:hypothetical protein
MQPPETIEAKSRELACDGGGTLGHPRVFLKSTVPIAVGISYWRLTPLLLPIIDTPA